MKMILTGSILALGMLAITPAMAQGVYVGPGGVGVDTGIHHRGYDRDRDYDREDYRPHHRDYYEGRSAYPNRYYDER